MARTRITPRHVGLDCFLPVFESDFNFMLKCKNGQEILTSSTRPRYPRHHKLIFALANCAIKNAKSGSILERMIAYDFIKACMKAEKIVDMTFNFDGSIDYEAKSISFEDMNEDEFEPVSDAVFKWTAHYLEVEEHLLRDDYEFYLTKYNKGA